jgi:hypothetical protein
MSSPPPDQWRPPQPMGGPSQGPPFGPPPWGPPQPPGPPNRGSGSKWVLGAVVLLVVVAVSVGATLLFTRGDNGGESPTGTASPTSTSGPASDVASANDKGPVKIITDEPTCAAWTPVNNTLAERQRNGWDRRDVSLPATAWSPEQRAQFESVATALRTAADEAIPLAKQTPHRVMRELYEQFIAYSRAYADAVPAYTEADDHLVRVSVGISAAVSGICDAITYGTAAARAPYLPDPAPMSQTAPPGDPANPQIFLRSIDPICGDWEALVSQFATDTAAWRTVDPNIPAAQWDPAQRDINTAVEPVMRDFATSAAVIGRRSDNPTLRDFAVLASQYRRAYAYALATYTAADHYLQIAASGVVGTVSEACAAAEG